MMEKHKLWIFTFEYGPVKLGGLGQVTTNQVKHLGDKLDICVFLPAHGLNDGKSLENTSWTLEKRVYSIRFKQDFAPIGQIDDLASGDELAANKIELSVDVIEIKNPEFKAKSFILSGYDDVSRKYLNDPVVYGKQTLWGKIAIFSQAMNHYTRFISKKSPGELPDVIHVHDYHYIPGFITLQQQLGEKGMDVASIYTVHLLTGPRVSRRYLECCGVSDIKMPVFIGGDVQYHSPFELLQIKEGKLEFLSGVISDLVTSVSKSYLMEAVVPSIGTQYLSGKIDFIYNGCDWDFNEIFTRVVGENRNDLARFGWDRDVYNESTRKILKRFLMTWKLEHLPPSEPVIPDTNILKIIQEYDGIYPYIKSGRVSSFHGAGKLALVTGRASKQKGIDLIFTAIPKIIEEYPDIFFLFLLLPTQGEINLVERYLKLSISNDIKEYVRLLYGRAPSIYQLAHLSADIYLGVSNWEPFGIMVLEANSVGLPVIGSRTGGIKETILDIRENPKDGTGLLIKKNDPVELSRAVIDLCNMINGMESIHGGLAKNKVQISDPRLNRLFLADRKLYLRMRNNARKRVESKFRWKMVSVKEIELVEKAIKIHEKIRR
ncbi:MAG: glycosyltransferase [Promethearchaeota archaeon]